MKYLIIIILLIFFQNRIVLGQTTSLEEEMEIGFTCFQDALYANSLEHFEKVINKIPPTYDYDETYAFVLYICSLSALEIGNYEKSLLFCKKALSLHNAPIEYNISILGSQLQVYKKILDYANCEKVLKQLEKIYDRNDINQTIKIDILAKIVLYYAENKFYDIIKVYEKKTPAMIIPDKISDIDKKGLLINWNTIYNGFAISYSETKNHEKALIYFLKAAEVLIPDIENNRQSLYYNIAKEYYIVGDIDKALDYQIKAVELLDDINNDTSYVAKQFLQLGILYDSKYMYKEALVQFEKAYSLYLSINDTVNQAYTQVMLYHVYYALGKKEKYIPIRTYLESIILGNTIKDTEISLIINSKLGDFYKEDGKYEKALEIYYKYLEKAKVFYGDKSLKLLPHYYNTASLLLTIGNYNSAAQMINCAKQLFSNTSFESNDYYSLILLESDLNIKRGNLGKAISSLEKLSLQIELAPTLHYNIYSTLGGIYGEIGEFERSLKYHEIALDLTEKIYGKKSANYAYELINLSELHAVLENRTTALELTQSACNIFEELYGKESQQYYDGLKKLAMRYHGINDKIAKELAKTCLSLSKSIYGEESNEYAENLFFSIELLQNSTEEDISKILRSIEIKRKIGQTSDITYLHFLSIYSTLLYVDRDWTSLYMICTEIIDTLRTYLARNFRYFTERNRETVWNRIKHTINGIESYAAEYSHYAVESADYSLVNEYGGLAYDVRLLAKGFLLSASERLEELLQISDNRTHNTLQQNIMQLRTMQKISEKDFFRKENIEQKIQTSERNLMELASKRGNYLDFTSIKWQDIQDNLLPGEVAIEIFSHLVQDEIQYGAVWLTKNSDPIALDLFCEFELDKFKRRGNAIYDYTNPGLYKIIWSVLENFSDIKNAHTIYISADNLLNTISVENLCDSDGKLASEKRKIFRLTSTRELIRKNNIKKKYLSAILYGGLNYNATISQIQLANKQITKSNQRTTNRYKKVRSLRDKADYLGWTLAEVNNIAKLMKKYNPEVLSGHEGTEESLMAIHLKSPSILHIATHGFYYDTKEIYNKMRTTPEKYQFLDSTSVIKPTVESLAMKGSGLLLSGANLTLSGQKITEDIEDGILTAEELSLINLRSVDLAVLSACDTGLGKVSEEGVFGLQRGFKLAGVNSLLMSLWKVDDEATAILMINFYRNLLKGVSKIESLQKAKQYVKSIPRFKSPEYWAGFILLDALN